MRFIEADPPPIDAGQDSRHCHPPLGVPKPPSVGAVVVRQIYVVGFALQDAIGGHHYVVVAGQLAGLNVTASFGAPIKQNFDVGRQMAFHFVDPLIRDGGRGNDKSGFALTGWQCVPAMRAVVLPPVGVGHVEANAVGVLVLPAFFALYLAHGWSLTIFLLKYFFTIDNVGSF